VTRAPIAIVGRACLLPGADSPEALWANVLAGRDLLSNAPADRWRLSKDLAIASGSSRDRSLHDRGGYVTTNVDVPEAKGLDPQVAWLIWTARKALTDARLARTGKLGAIFGNLSFPTSAMAELYEAPHLGRSKPNPRNRFMSGLPALILEETLGLSAGSFALDAACASSLYAVKLACDSLNDGRSDVMLAGAVNRSDDLFIHVGFTALSALSKKGHSRPFDSSADGLVPAEGAAFLVLKRLEDARKDGDRIWGVIRGVGLSNDGRGRGFLAPSELGQAAAMQAAFAGSGLSPSDIELLECHATGTPVGDATEIRSIESVYRGVADLPIGSLKSNLGHLITAAGAAGIIKLIGAMEAGIKPPTLHVSAPIDALKSSPLRPLIKAEPWEGRKRAAISAFGFGGNNAHLLLEAHDASLPTRRAQPSKKQIAIVGVGVQLGDQQTLEPLLFEEARPEPATDVAVKLEGLKFPPADLAQTLPQQLLMLGAAEKAIEGAGLGQDTAVLIGMGADVEVCRYGLRWRLAEHARREGLDAAWLKSAQDRVIPVLESAGVVGTMPNVVANRLSSHFDFRGPGYTISSEERSGVDAIKVAVRALREGEVGAALVGAVDLGSSSAHVAATEAIFGPRAPGTDAAVALLLMRKEDAVARGRPILALIDEDTDDAVRLPDLSARLGHAHAAHGLLSIAAGVVCLSRRMLPGGKPWLAKKRALKIECQPMAGRAGNLRLLEGEAIVSGAAPVTGIFVYAGADLAAVQSRLLADEPGGEGPARCVIVASLAERSSKAAMAAERIAKNQPSWPGARWAAEPIGGEVAFVFSAAGAAYPGMGKTLLRALPELHAGLGARFEKLGEALDWSFAERAPTPIERLWGTAALSQAHHRLAHEILGIHADAVIGYSSGESASLFALGVWRDLGAMYADSIASGLFVARPSWATWAVRAPLSEVQAVLQSEPSVRLAIVHSDVDCVISGDAEACSRVVGRIGESKAQRIHYDLAVHVPESEADLSRWNALHDRETHATDVRVYGNASHAAYAPSREACRDAVTAQAMHHLDLRPTFEAAYRDGVRTFVELGPRGAVSTWIRQVLGDRRIVTVAFDDEGGGLPRLDDALATLLAHGIRVDVDALTKRFAPSPKTDRSLSFPAHRPEIRLPMTAVLESEPVLARAPADDVITMMPHAPSLPPILEADAPAPEVIATPIVEVLAAEEHAPLSAHPIADAHRAFLESQTEAHQHFLAARRRLTALLKSPDVRPISNTPVTSARPSDLEFSGTIRAAEITAPTSSADHSRSVGHPEISGDDSRSVGRPGISERPVEPIWGRRELEIHAGGRISEIFGERFAAQDQYARQVRMPEPPLLLADRVTMIDAEPGSMGLGKIGTATDVKVDGIYMHEGRMTPGLMIESGQADLMLISYLGVDLLNRGERVYRLLGCELTYHHELPVPGETLDYEIHVDGHAQQGDIRLFFFHYDCVVEGQPRLSVRQGQAGFFTDKELADSAGVLWSPESQKIVEPPRLDPPAIPGAPKRYDATAVTAFREGRPAETFGEGFEYLETHVRTPRIPGGKLALFDRVTSFDPSGGPWQRGYLSAELDIHADDWFFGGHFKNDPCMPGTLMFDGCIQAMSFYLTAMGFTVARDGHRFAPVTEHPIPLRCRGQVTPTSKKLTYEIFVEEIEAGPMPTIWADVLCTVDGLKAFHARRLGIRLVPDWPITSRPELLDGHVDKGPVAKIGDFEFGYASLLACAWGKPSDAFGEMYKIFDGTRRVARLPGPPYHFMSRVPTIDGQIGLTKPGAKIEIAYDIPPDAWYFDANGAKVMPFAVLLEAALQPCGWLASFVGSAVEVAEDLSFRNLDGTGTLLVDLIPTSGTMVTKVEIKSVSKNGGTIIEGFAVECFVGDTKIYQLSTVFGFFPKAALENQVGLPTTDAQRALLTAPSTFTLDLEARPARYTENTARLAEPMLLMIDRVTAFDPTGGEKGLGFLRAEKDVDPSEWFFKAHFFQDPVQPGSLGIEAMIQLLQFYMLHTRMDRGMSSPRFESLALGRPMSWKYRGQVVPKNKLISTTLEITETGKDDRGAYAVATASLWVDGKRIYEAKNLGMRLVSDPGAVAKTPKATTIDPAKDTWVHDHCKWLTLDKPVTLEVERDQDRTTLVVDGQKIAGARFTALGSRPAPWPALEGPESPSPYATATLFHGPAFQKLTRLVATREGSSAILDASGALPGKTNWVLLDAATHGIDHEAEGLVHYPASIVRLAMFEPLPTEGTVRCEMRHMKSPGVGLRRHHLQLIRDDRVLCEIELLEAGFPKGRLGQFPPLPRKAFLQGQHGTGVRMSREVDGTTFLGKKEVAGHDWLPGTVRAIYGTNDPAQIAAKEHWAARSGVHPRHLPEALPLNLLPTQLERHGDEAIVRGDPLALDLGPVKAFWRDWFGRGPWPIEDLYYGLIERFIGKVVLDDPAALAQVRGKSVLFLANHQVAIESLLFSVIASAIQQRVTVTLAKIEHKTTWVGKLIERSFSFPQIRDPKVIEFFDRSDRESLPEVITGLRDRLAERALMVHVEGTRSLECKTPIQKMSGAFIDLAIATDTPIVPVRFVGALPTTALSERIELPIGMTKQDIWIGKPLLPAELASLTYGARKQEVLGAINALALAAADEVPNPPNAELEAKIRRTEAELKTGIEKATLASVILDGPATSPEAATLARAIRGESIPRTSPESEWIGDFAAWLRGA
jgi:acyl transferase domain-containing protein/3-hydroxymyristoyl/3-hydroxydecanoyl-(acyl carrier protein) dehydratase